MRLSMPKLRELSWSAERDGGSTGSIRGCAAFEVVPVTFTLVSSSPFSTAEATPTCARHSLPKQKPDIQIVQTHSNNLACHTATKPLTSRRGYCAGRD